MQGDEPIIPPKIIYQVADDLAKHDNVNMATLCEPIRNVEELLNGQDGLIPWQSEPRPGVQFEMKQILYMTSLFNYVVNIRHFHT